MKQLFIGCNIDHRARGRLIVFLDETVFSKKALKLQEYSAKNTSLCVEQE